MKVKLLPKLIVFALVVGGGLGLVRHLVYTGVIPRPNALKSLIPVKAEEINAEVLQTSSSVKVVDLGTNKPMSPCMDGNTSNCLNGPVHQMEIWAWNANGGLIVATGGAKYQDGQEKGIQTGVGSLYAKHGVNVKIRRQDDSGEMKKDLVKTADALKSDPNAQGIKFVTIMGDGGAQFFKDVEKLSPTTQLEVVGVTGYSRGEDSFLGPAAWKSNCEAMRGGLTIGVVRDGDWNIALKKLGQCNNIPNNPDETVYDPNAMNWKNADSYTKAAEMFVGGDADRCVDLPVKGKLNTKIHKCADAVVTWTPGDVTVAKNRGGVVPILSTRQSVFQMPCILVGIKQWDAAHADDVKNILAAALEGADQMRSNSAALKLFGDASAALYAEQTPAYWVKYYKGVTEPDATGVPIQLGGSAVSNLADNLQAFGLAGGPNLFAATYNTFGKIVVQQYPKMYPDFPPVNKILNTSYIQAVRAMGKMSETNAENIVPTTSSAPMNVEGKRNYSIQFASGKATILPVSFSTLNDIADEVVITKYAVALHGYTDAAKWAGMSPDDSAARNMQLSDDRAHAVEAYLRQHGIKNVIRTYPHGEEDPLASNATVQGQAQNRRVQIVLGTVN
jgi:outer membrane protein OmpA-like peptidoglycan-associated protein